MTSKGLNLWSVPRTDLLTILWKDAKLSASEIAGCLNELPGTKLTRNAIHGKVWRLHLGKRRIGARPVNRPARRPALPPVKVRAHRLDGGTPPLDDSLIPPTNSSPSYSLTGGLADFQ